LPIEKPRKGQKSRRSRKPDDPEDTACQRSGMRGRQGIWNEETGKEVDDAETKINRPY
jgi:hypothetical protein